jgi:glycosyltransferase involved in cell wall biosynthesis
VNLTALRLGFYYHIPALLKDGKIWLPGYLGRFLDSLAKHIDHLTLFLHEPNDEESHTFDYEIRSKNIVLVQLPQSRSVPYRIINSRQYTKIIQENLSSLDAILVRGPTPLLPHIVRRTNRIPAILLIVGDYLAGIDSLPQPRWRKELIRIWSWSNYLGQLRAAKKSLVFVNSAALYKNFIGKAGRLAETRTTTLEDNDFFVREDTCLERPVQLLYTGRMDPAKGLLDMVEAVSILIEQGENVILNLVGWPEKGSNILDEIKNKAKEKNLTDRVLFHGYKPVGQELFAYYQRSDIYVLASRSSFEGFPRTIWEAMAHSIPVVATKVGSIPNYIVGSAELISPESPEAIASAVSRLIHNSELRKLYISKGIELAKGNTLEIQSREMVMMMKIWLESKNV